MAIIKERKKTIKPVKKVTKEEQELAAYYRWLERGQPQGDGFDDWLAVESKWKDNIVPFRND